jgi:TetR/AcrR family transcriptional regulator, transcriptional repressor for nem operon
MSSLNLSTDRYNPVFPQRGAVLASPTDTRELIMATARRMVQARGYNALSFRDLADLVGIKSASVHYHFPTKGMLAAALARRYTEEGVAHLDLLGAAQSSIESLIVEYSKIFRAALVDDNRMCLCGIMAAETGDLPEEVRTEVKAFNDANVAWLSRLLMERRPDMAKPQARSRAAAIFAAMEGAQLVARSRGDVKLFDSIIEAYRQAGLFS